MEKEIVGLRFEERPKNSVQDSGQSGCCQGAVSEVWGRADSSLIQRSDGGDDQDKSDGDP